MFLSFADHRQVRLCLFQNGLRHRITLYPPSRKVSFFFCFAFCVYVPVFTRPYTWSQYSWTLGSHPAGWRGLETKRRLFFVNLSSDMPKEKVVGIENVMVRVVRRWCGAHIPSYELGCDLGLCYHETQYAIKLKRVILSQCFFFLTENYLFVAKSAGCYYSWFFRSVVSTRHLFFFDVSTLVTFKLSLVTFAQLFFSSLGRDYLTNRGHTHKCPMNWGIFST